MTTLIDYAAPMMRIESLLKEMHNKLLDRDMTTTSELCLVLIAEARVLQNTLVIMKEKDDALRKQTTTLQERI
jgi:hypothetical protein